MSVSCPKRILIAFVLVSCTSENTTTDDIDGAADASDDASTCDMPRTFYVDEDRDGFGRPGEGAIHGCESVPPAGFSLNARDCSPAPTFFPSASAAAAATDPRRFSALIVRRG